MKTKVGYESYIGKIKDAVITFHGNMGEVQLNFSNISLEELTEELQKTQSFILKGELKENK